MNRIACLFPGIGYTCDKPLLYYSWKLLGDWAGKLFRFLIRGSRPG